MSFTRAEDAPKRKRRSKWDVPGDTQESNGLTSSSHLDGEDLSDAALKAKERAAQLAAKLAAQGKLSSAPAPPPLVAQPVGVPADLAKQNTLSVPPPTGPLQKTLQSSTERFQIKKLDLGGYIAEVEINDLPARVMLTKGAVQDQIANKSGAAVSTRGKYMTAEEKARCQATGSSERSLYLSVIAAVEAKVRVALQKIYEMIDNYGKPSAPSRQNQLSSNTNTPPPGMHYVQDKVFVGLDHAHSEFNVKEKLEGPNGSYLQHIILQTGAKVHLRGRGSGYMEQTSGRESFEALYIYISHPRPDGLASAKSLCENLIQTVHSDFRMWEQSKMAAPPHQPQGYIQQPNAPQSNGPRYGQPPPSYPPARPTYPEQRPPQPYSGYRGVPGGPPAQPPSYPQAPPAGPYPPRNYPPPTAGYPPQSGYAPPPSYPPRPTQPPTSYPPYSSPAQPLSHVPSAPPSTVNHPTSPVNTARPVSPYQNYPPPPGYHGRPPPPHDNRPRYPPGGQPPPSHSYIPPPYPAPGASPGGPPGYPPMPPGGYHGQVPPPGVPLPVPVPSASQPTMSNVAPASSHTEAAPTEPKRRRFTEDPSIIRQASQPEDDKASTSPSLDSTTSFRSPSSTPTAAEDTRLVVPDRNFPTASPMSPPISPSMPPPAPLSKGEVSKGADMGFKAPPPPSTSGFKAPTGLIPVKTKPKHTDPPAKKKLKSEKPVESKKNALSSLIPYGDDSDSDESDED